MTPTIKQHTWENKILKTGKEIKRCTECFYSFAYGQHLPCPGAHQTTATKKIKS